MINMPLRSHHRLTACIWFGLTPSPKSPSATSDTRETICAQCDGRIIEVTLDKKIVWMYGVINTPAGMERLENGNTLLAVYGENRVIEVAAP